MYYYVDNGRSGNSIKVHLSNKKEYIEANTPIWSKKAQAYKIGSIDFCTSAAYKLYFVVVEKYRYNEFNVVKIFGSRDAAKRWVYNKKRSIYPKEYSFNIVIATCNYIDAAIPSDKDRLEDHDYTYRYDGGDYVVLDHGSIVARLDNLTEAKEWIAEAEEELRRNAE